MASVSASVSIPNAHLRRGGDATVTRGMSFSPDVIPHAYPRSTSLQPAHDLGLKPKIAVDRLGDVNVDASDVRVVGEHPGDGGNGAGKPTLNLLSEAAGAITPALLAKHYLPNILLQHGPLAIRHITAHLISSLPGFSSVPPARQRRMIVGALEGRGGVSGPQREVGGVDGDVIFDKVGWGRWDARRKGEAPRERGGTDSSLSVPVATQPSKHRTNGLLSGVPSGGADMNISTSYQGEAGIFMQSEEEADEDMVAADRMSLDGDSSTSSSEDDDMTDEEDWAQMGPEMLRRRGGSSPLTSDGWNSSYVWSPSGPVLWSAGKPGAPAIHHPDELRAQEEREAVEALLKLGSV